MNDVVTFAVEGKYGPMTLALAYQGRHPSCPKDTPEEVLRTLTREEVQEWYTHHGWPRQGTLQSRDRSNHYRAVWKMV